MLRIAEHDSVLLLTMERPARRNALHPDMIGALSSALSKAEANPACVVVVLTGAGTSFSAGLDLDHLASLDAEGRVGYMASAFALFEQVYTLTQPVIAAVNGPAMAGGFDLAAFCDIRLCSPTARFAQTEILLGLTQIMYPVYKTIGLGRAKEMALTGDVISAEEAYRIGLVSRVCPAEQLLDDSLELAAHLASRPRQALFATKRLSRELPELNAAQAFTRMFDAICERLRSAEHDDAVQQYVARLRRG